MPHRHGNGLWRAASGARLVGIVSGGAGGLLLLATTLFMRFLDRHAGEGAKKLAPALPFLALTVFMAGSVALLVISGDPLRGVRRPGSGEIAGHAVFALLFLIDATGKALARPDATALAVAAGQDSAGSPLWLIRIRHPTRAVGPCAWCGGRGASAAPVVGIGAGR